MWKEAIDICDGESLVENLACIVSIGTGVQNIKKFGNNVKEVMNSIVRIATETEETANTFNHTHPELNKGNQRYFRFNVPRTLAEIGLDEASEAGTSKIVQRPEWQILLSQSSKFLHSSAPTYAESI